MRIAILTPYLPDPPITGGRIRIYHLVKQASLHHRLDLYAVAAARELRNPAVQAGLQRFQSRYMKRPPLTLGHSPLRSRRVAQGNPRGALSHFWAEHKRQPYDLIWVEHVHAAGLAMQTGLPFILDEHNIESRYLEDKFKAQGPLGPIKRRQIELLRRFERSVWARAQEVFAVTPADQAHIAAYRARPPILLPNGVDLSLIDYRPPKLRDSHEVLFVGLMNHPPNEHAALFLAKSVMPLVEAQIPTAKLVLCGANPSRAVLQLTGPKVEVTGTVESVAPYLSRAGAYAFALFHGAGSSLKLLEAFAAGVPVVASQVAVRGYPVQANAHYRQAEDAETFAQQLIELLKKPPEADGMADAARAIAEDYDWSNLGSRLLAALDASAV